MKKALSIISAAAVLFSAAPTYAAADVTITPQQFAACDFNSDGYVDTIDLLFMAIVSLPNFDTMRDMAASRVGLTAEIEQKILKNGDFNGNGAIDEDEGTAFLDYMVNNTECKIDDLSLSDMTEMTKLMDPSKKLGDIDGDDIINAVDASNVLKYYAITSTGASFDTITMLAARHKGDMNGNRIVDSVDAALILKKYAENSVAK
ncbi:MAG: hypothetical protein IKW96_00855 [Ruminococcus sp.]|uniref:hypothetical protein n=1 Tax=Ruminococcus sp. TaxID=41978 RepID=UPI0025F229CE|nr:hypothetical protein [Ruminococcus sp.]MBR5681813.1 hypothetical protein [Ruminococcus sp.]